LTLSPTRRNTLAGLVGEDVAAGRPRGFGPAAWCLSWGGGNQLVLAFERAGYSE
jgi:hypothetical protein